MWCQRDQNLVHLFWYIVAFSLPSVKTTFLDRWTIFNHSVLLVTKWTSTFQVKGACKFLVISWPWEVYMLWFFDIQSSHTLNNIFGKFRKQNSEQRTKLTKTNVLIRMIDGINIKKRNSNSKYNKPLHRLYQFIQAMLSRNYWRMYSRMSRTEQFKEQ